MNPKIGKNFEINTPWVISGPKKDFLTFFELLVTLKGDLDLESLK